MRFCFDIIDKRTVLIYVRAHNSRSNEQTVRRAQQRNFANSEFLSVFSDGVSYHRKQPTLQQSDLHCLKSRIVRAINVWLQQASGRNRNQWGTEFSNGTSSRTHNSVTMCQYQHDSPFEREKTTIAISVLLINYSTERRI